MLNECLAQNSDAHMPSSSSVLLMKPVMSALIADARVGQSCGKRWVTICVPVLSPKRSSCPSVSRQADISSKIDEEVPKTSTLVNRDIHAFLACIPVTDMTGNSANGRPGSVSV